jgi:hypothetical protein
MAGLVPAIHVLLAARKAWTAATSAAMAVNRIKLLESDLKPANDPKRREAARVTC